jgi:transcriptional regulator with XRE-family HTH domain
MDPADLCRIEAGESERGPSLSIIHRLAKALGVQPAELLRYQRSAA